MDVPKDVITRSCCERQIQGHTREHTQWQYGLRGDMIDVLEGGVLRIVVSDNQLGDEGISYIAEVLEEDLFYLVRFASDGEYLLDFDRNPGSFGHFKERHYRRGNEGAP